MYIVCCCSCSACMHGIAYAPGVYTCQQGKWVARAQDFGHFYGSSYVSAPDASRTPYMPRDEDGLLIADLDLNLCRQARHPGGHQHLCRALAGMNVRCETVPSLLLRTRLYMLQTSACYQAWWTRCLCSVLSFLALRTWREY